jgi:NAD(P)-dependent dehydrogenase (short-subunit alcohol dehydrogenase family)
VDKVALVTGGARGIGKAIATLLAARGWQVAVADVRASAEFFFLKCDVSREAAVRSCLNRVIRRLGRLDALVNNAGIADPTTGPVERLKLAEWNRRIATNLTGAFLMAKHASPHLRRARGAIVNIASTRALQAEPGNEAYAASKAGLIGLTQALALSLGPAVRVNCVSPGWIAHQPVRRKDHAQHPVGRVGRAGFVTAQNFVIDGGMTKKMIYV